mmetsp:Transcript_74607/g.180434  ORF Transcript_74607/g.180434 Transcript_74607/m.180434 type:complete len:89 (-) Transcript_74607:36-302(-)
MGLLLAGSTCLQANIRDAHTRRQYMHLAIASWVLTMLVNHGISYGHFGLDGFVQMPPQGEKQAFIFDAVFGTIYLVPFLTEGSHEKTD